MDKNLIHEIFQGIVDVCRPHFRESTFTLKTETNQFVISGDVISEALNHYRNEQEQVKVLRWFDDFWVYIEVRLAILKKEFPRISVSISVFQSEQDDPYKTQLFRAEWDSYDNNDQHAQPHWHLYPHKYHREVYEDFEAYSEMINEGIDEILQDNLKRIIDIRRIHFAMNAEWANRQGAIHQLSDLDKLKNWLNGLFSDIRFQIGHARREG